MWQKMSNYGLKLHLQQLPGPKCVMGFDFGLKNTGISISGLDLKHAFYLTTIRRDIRSKEFNEEVVKLIFQQKPVSFVVGQPNFVSEAQNKESIIQLSNQFLANIYKEHNKLNNLKYTVIDESWTTQEAKKKLRQIQQQIKNWGHLRKQKELVDGMAAIIILRKFIDYYNKN